MDRQEWPCQPTQERRAVRLECAPCEDIAIEFDSPVLSDLADGWKVEDEDGPPEGGVLALESLG